MNINSGLIGQAITFAFFIWITMKYVWPVIMAVMDERDQKIADGLAAAERGHYELDKAHEKAKTIINDAMVKATEIIEKANQRASVIVENSECEAKEKYKQILAAAESDVAQQALKLKEEIKNEVANIVVLGAEKIIKKKIDKNIQDEILSDFVANL